MSTKTKYNTPDYMQIDNSRVYYMIGDSHIFTHFRYLITLDSFSGYKKPNPIKYEEILNFGQSERDWYSDDSAEVVNLTDIKYEGGNIIYESDYVTNIVRFCFDNDIECPDSLLFQMA